MAIVATKAASLTEFCERVFAIREEWSAADQDAARRGRKDAETCNLWFRSLEDASWDLVPTLYRLAHSDEDELRTEFRNRGIQLISELRTPKDDREWYFLMRHYGTPTRLLDWTDGALLALYFAVRTQLLLESYKTAAVWVLDPDRLNKIVTHKESIMLYEWREAKPWFPEPFNDTLSVKLPIAVDPPHVSRRAAVQRSRFTIHGTQAHGLEDVAVRKEARLVKIEIPEACIEQIGSDLATCGIAETSIMPDLEGLSRELTMSWCQRTKS